MDKLFLAIVVSGILVLVTAAGLFATRSREKTAVHAPYPFSQQRH
jgi:hypothetical protein